MQIPLWPPKEFVCAHMPKIFQQKYPSTRVIIDATEVYIKQSSLAELQQRSPPTTRITTPLRR